MPFRCGGCNHHGRNEEALKEERKLREEWMHCLVLHVYRRLGSNAEFQRPLSLLGVNH